MAAFDFPATPTVNQTYTLNGVTYQWNGTAWIGTVLPIGEAPSDNKNYARKNATWVDTAPILAPLPVSAAALGQWRGLQGTNGSALVLPAGGTWAYAYIGSNTSSGVITLGFQGGIAAGGATVQAGAANVTYHGFCWRLT
jgi:hypothetical protein